MAKKDPLSLADLIQSAQKNKTSISPAIQAQLDAANAISPDIKPPKSSGVDSSISELNKNLVKLIKVIQENTNVLDATSRITKGRGPTSKPSDNDLTETKLEDQRVTDYQTKLLEKIELNTRKGKGDIEKEEKEAKTSWSKIGLLATTIAGALGLLSGVLWAYTRTFLKLGKEIAKGVYELVKVLTPNYIKQLGPKIINGIRNLSDKLIINIENSFRTFIEAVRNRFPKIFNSISQAIENTVSVVKKLFGSGKNGIGNIVKWFTEVKSSVIAFFEPIKAAFSMIKEGSTIVKKITGTVKSVSSYFTKTIQWFSAFGKVFKALFIIGEKLAWPITIILGLIEAIPKTIEKWKQTGSMLETLAEFSRNMLKSIVGDVANLLKNIISWISEKLGFTEFSKMLDSIDFNKWVDVFVDTMTNVYKAIGEAITHPMETFKKMVDGLGKWMRSIEIPAVDIPVLGKFGPWKPFAENKPAEAKPLTPAQDTANKVYNKSAQNREADKKVAQPKSNTIITAPTQVNTQTQNAFVKTPIRNQESTLKNYYNAKFV